MTSYFPPIEEQIFLFDTIVDLESVRPSEGASGLSLDDASFLLAQGATAPSPAVSIGRLANSIHHHGCVTSITAVPFTNRYHSEGHRPPSIRMVPTNDVFREKAEL